MKPIILSVLRARTTGTPPTKETFKDEAPMLGLMQNRPLLISDLVDYVATWHAETEIVSRDPDPARRVPLWIAVDQQRPLLGDRQARGKVHGGGRLSDPALLIGYRDDSGHTQLR